jgi:hypothetical protein
MHQAVEVAFESASFAELRHFVCKQTYIGPLYTNPQVLKYIMIDVEISYRLACLRTW